MVESSACNTSGEWLFGCFAYCVHTINMNVELVAIARVLVMTSNVGFHLIICESDSLLTLLLLEDLLPLIHPYVPLISHIKKCARPEFSNI